MQFNICKNINNNYSAYRKMLNLDTFAYLRKKENKHIKTRLHNTQEMLHNILQKNKQIRQFSKQRSYQN